MSDLLTPAQIAEIAARAEKSLPNTMGKWPGDAIRPLLRHAAAQAARIERLRKACEDVVKFDPSGDGPGWMFLMEDCARALAQPGARP